MKPIVSQLVVEQPLGLVPDAASVEGVDEIALLLGGNSYSVQGIYLSGRLFAPSLPPGVCVLVTPVGAELD